MMWRKDFNSYEDQPSILWAGVGTGEENNGQAVVQEAGPEDEAEKKDEESGRGIPHHMMYT